MTATTSPPASTAGRGRPTPAPPSARPSPTRTGTDQQKLDATKRFYDSLMPFDLIATYRLADDSNNTLATSTAATHFTNPGPDLTVTKTHTGNFFQGQTGASYTLTVHNIGTAP